MADSPKARLLYERSLLMRAAYAEFQNTGPDNDARISQRLLDAGFDDIDAKYFVERYRLVEQSPEHANGSGFSATLFRFKDSGKPTLASRGTEPVSGFFNDGLSADLSIALHGQAQLGPLVAWQLAKLETYHQSLRDRGLLDPNEEVDMTGHSLGAWLSTAFTRRHPEAVSHTYGFNAPGSGGVLAEVADQLGIAPDHVPNAQITIIRSSNTLSIVEGLGILHGRVHDVPIAQGPPTVSGLDPLAALGTAFGHGSVVISNEFRALTDLEDAFPEKSLAELVALRKELTAQRPEAAPAHHSSSTSDYAGSVPQPPAEQPDAAGSAGTGQLRISPGEEVGLTAVTHSVRVIEGGFVQREVSDQAGEFVDRTREAESGTVTFRTHSTGESFVYVRAEGRLVEYRRNAAGEPILDTAREIDPDSKLASSVPSANGGAVSWHEVDGRVASFDPRSGIYSTISVTADVTTLVERIPGADGSTVTRVVRSDNATGELIEEYRLPSTQPSSGASRSDAQDLAPVTSGERPENYGTGHSVTLDSVSTIGVYAGSLQSALGLYQAIDAGDAPSIAGSAVRFADLFARDPKVIGAALGGSTPTDASFLDLGGLGALGAGLSLYTAIDRGDALGIVSSGLALGAALDPLVEGAISSALGLTQGALSGIMPGLGLVSGLASGDPLSIIAGAAAFIPVWGPVIAVAISVIGAIFGGLFDDEEEPPPPRPWGEGALHWDASGRLTYSAIGGDHTNQVDERYGREPVERVLAGLVDYLNEHTPEGYGVIPGRLPLLHYEQAANTFTLTLHDPVTGSPYARTFHSTTGYALDRTSGPEALDTFHQVFLREAERQRAIAPEFEIDRILEGGLATSSLAAVQSGAAFEATRSLISEAGATGHAALEDPDSPTRAFNPITVGLPPDLGLPQSLVPAGLDTPAMLFDLSRNGYVSLTEWAKASQAVLAVDLDADGRITHGEEVFSDARVDGAYRGTNYLARYDRDGSGAIDARDPIYPALVLWLRVQGTEGAWEDVLLGLTKAGVETIDLAAGTAHWTDDTISTAATASLLAERDEHRYTPMEGAVHDEVRGKGETVYIRETQALSQPERTRLLGAGGPLSAILAEQEGSSLLRIPTAPFERWLVALAVGASAAAAEVIAAPDLAHWTADAPYVPPASRAQGEPALAPVDWTRPDEATGASVPAGAIPLGDPPAWSAPPVREGFVLAPGAALAPRIDALSPLPSAANALLLDGAAAIEEIPVDFLGDPLAVLGVPIATQHAINNTALTLRPERLADLDDPQLGVLTVSALNGATHGAVRMLEDGSILFEPEPGFAGEASFRFTLTSVSGTERVHEARVLVTRAEDETAYAMANRARSYDSGYLTATDDDYSGRALQVLTVGNAAGGRVGFDTAGNVTFLPDAGFAGPAGFDYLVEDAWGNTYTNRHTLMLTATHDETVRAINDVARVYGQAELTATDENWSGAPLVLAATGAATHGTATLDTQNDADPLNDRVVFVPEPGFAGFASFRYTVRDQWGNEADNLATVGVSRIVDAPALHTMNGVAFSVGGTRLTSQNDDGSGAPMTLLSLTGLRGFDWRRGAFTWTALGKRLKRLRVEARRGSKLGVVQTLVVVGG